MAEQGDLSMQADMAEDMEEKDTHLQSELGKRRRAIQSVNWTIEPPRNASAEEKRDTAMIQDLLEDADWWEDMVFDATDAILKGYSGQQITWGRVEKLFVPLKIQHKDPAIFQLSPEDRDTLVLNNATWAGEPLAPLGWIMHRAKSKSGYTSRIGLVRTLIWPFIFKNYSVRDLAEFLEIYGLPLRLGRYPSGASEKEKATLLRAVMQIGHNAGGIIPQGMEIDFNNAADGQSDPFVAMMDWAEKSISKAILGGTLTSQADGKTSTNALGSVHNEVRTEVRNSDLKQLAITLNRDLIGPLFTNNSFKYGCDLRSNAGYSFWQLAFAGLCDLNGENLWTCWQSMRSITGDGDRKLAIRPTHLVVPPGLERAATRLLKNDLVAGEHGTESNEWVGRLELIVADYL